MLGRKKPSWERKGVGGKVWLWCKDNYTQLLETELNSDFSVISIFLADDWWANIPYKFCLLLIGWTVFCASFPCCWLVGHWPIFRTRFPCCRLVGQYFVQVFPCCWLVGQYSVNFSLLMIGKPIFRTSFPRCWLVGQYAVQVSLAYDWLANIPYYSPADSLRPVAPPQQRPQRLIRAPDSRPPSHMV